MLTLGLDDFDAIEGRAILFYAKTLAPRREGHGEQRLTNLRERLLLNCDLRAKNTRSNTDIIEQRFSFS